MLEAIRGCIASLIALQVNKIALKGLLYLAATVSRSTVLAPLLGVKRNSSRLSIEELNPRMRRDKLLPDHRLDLARELEQAASRSLYNARHCDARLVGSSDTQTVVSSSDVGFG